MAATWYVFTAIAGPLKGKTILAHWSKLGLMYNRAGGMANVRLVTSRGTIKQARIAALRAQGASTAQYLDPARHFKALNNPRAKTSHGQKIRLAHFKAGVEAAKEYARTHKFAPGYIYSAKTPYELGWNKIAKYLRTRGFICAGCGKPIPRGFGKLCAPCKQSQPGAPFSTNAGRKNPGNPPRGTVDQVAADELVMYIENDADLYRQQYLPIVKNLWLKMKRGIYDHGKAIKLWGYMAISGAKKYHKEHGTPGTHWSSIFNVPTRIEAAKQLAEKEKRKLDNREYSLTFQKNSNGFQDNPRMVPTIQELGKTALAYALIRGGVRLLLKKKAANYYIWIEDDGDETSISGITSQAAISNLKKHFPNSAVTLYNPGKAALFRHKRLVSPGKFRKGSFRTITPKGRSDVRLIMGKLKGKRKMTVQAILTKKEKTKGERK